MRFRFDSKAGADTVATAAAKNNGAGYSITATTERGARRVLARKIGKAAADQMYVCWAGE